MAQGGSRTGLNGVPRVPSVKTADPALNDAFERVRLALQRLSGTNLLATGGGVVVNDDGRLDTDPAAVYKQLAAYEAANGLGGTL